uniref:hypothetical protein n=1 Tax=Pedobacter schmidteae TaxID=2201271 RepID=UPI000EB25043|nr:hypothetical protein [Pedobacter schmidteae]
MKGIKLGYLSLFLVIFGCSNGRVDRVDSKTVYRAIDKNDTATLSLRLRDQDFDGQLEINYHNLYTDSGGVTGIVKGDTLKGTYRFQHYGIETWRSIPIAILKKDDQLIMGSGAMEIYIGMTYFKKNAQIDYQNPKFVFKKVK